MRFRQPRATLWFLIFLGGSLIGPAGQPNCWATAFQSAAAGNWSSTATWQPALADASFEAPVNGTANSFIDFTGSPWTRTTPVWLIRPPSSLGSPNAVDGIQTIGIQTTGSITETLFWTAGTYALTGSAAQRAGQTQTLSIQIDGVQKGTVTPAGTAFATFSVSLGAITAGSHTIALVGLNPGGGDNMAFIDNLAITGGPGTVPANGDTATVNTAVTVDVDTTVGTSPSDTTTQVLTITNPGTLTVAAGKLFRVRGNAGQTGLGSDLTLSSGSILELDASAATTTTTKYVWTTATGSELGNTAPRILINGTSGSRCTVRSNAGGGNAGLTGSGANDWGRVFASYCDFIRLGSASTDALNIGAGFASSALSLDHCTLQTCGMVRTAVSAGATSTITNTTWSGSLGTSCLTTSNAATAAGQRTISGNVFDGPTSIRFDSIVVEDNVFLGFPDDPAAGSSSVKATSIARNFIRITGLSSGPRRGDWLNCYVVNDGSVYDGAGHYSSVVVQVNPHWTSPNGVNGTYACTGCVFESFGSDGVGDIDYGPNVASRSSRFVSCIVLPDHLTDTGQGFRNSGTLTTNNGFAGAASSYDKNTVYVGGQGALALAEGGNGFANMVISVRSNLVWNDARLAAGGFAKIAYYPTSPAGAVTDMITPGMCDYNGRWNLNPAHSQTGSSAYYDIRLSQPVGRHDVTGDPRFVDSSRTFTSWIKSLMGPSLPGNPTPANSAFDAYGLYLLSLRNSPNDPNFKPLATVSNLTAYIREGFAPQNPAYKASAHDGTTIGAVPYRAKRNPRDPRPTMTRATKGAFKIGRPAGPSILRLAA